MARTGNLEVGVVLDANDLKSGLQKVDRDISSWSSKTNRTLAGIEKSWLKFSAVVAGGFSAYKLAQFTSESIRLATAQEQAEKRLAAVIRATGGAAGYTASEMVAMANGLQDITTGSNDAIIAGQAILATFKNIRGEGFERATMAALDMSEVMQQDLKSSLLQIGKALNDPIANMGALSRAGVQFNESQKEMIKNLWESGDAIGAQNIILKELESEFGGAAVAARDTFGGAVKALSNTFDDLKKEIGYVITKNEVFRDGINKLNDDMKEMVGVAHNVGTAISEIYRAMQGKMTLKEFFLGPEGTWRPQPLTDAIKKDIEVMKHAAGMSVQKIPIPIEPEIIESKKKKLKFDDLTDSWRQAAAERYDVQSRSYQAETDLHQQLVDDIMAQDLSYTDFWQIQAQDRYDVQSRSYDAMAKDANENLKELEFLIGGWAKSSSDAIAEFATNGKFSFRDMVQSMIKDLISLMAYQTIMKPLFGAISGAFGGGGGVAGASSMDAFFNFHQGGIVGTTAPTRSLPSSLLAFAPRLHSGLRSDEYPAILQKGESVIPKGGTTGGDNYNVTINAIDTRSFSEYVRRNPTPIIEAVNRNVRGRGILRSTIRGSM